MDLLAACEDLAANTAVFDAVDDSDRSRWQALFGLSSSEAIKAIQEWRADFTRLTIPQEAWLLIKEAKMSEGFNKEPYEYSLSKAQTIQKRSAQERLPISDNSSTSNNEEAKFLVKMDCHTSADSVELSLCLPKKPNILSGIDDDGNTTRFCLLSNSEKTEFLGRLSKAHLLYQPTLIRVSIASKSLSPTSLYPTLGIDTTLPQFRLDNYQPGTDSSRISSLPLSLVRPAQDEYPVWYFFYGTLTDANVLSRAIGVSEKEDSIKYKRARIRRGRLFTLGRKYLALVDADEHSIVDGWAYLVKSQSEEDSLRVYETGKYEVVRCTIEFANENGGVIHGLTFRLAGLCVHMACQRR
ncbi:oxidoreductase domain containing [Trichoderma arundinaceum]|uniref:Putative gamma-glutamylcyclotransferase n=1 Tax=Trichoderma arundinaceum TaxID=490622 RepID=A0A395NAV4_TRIAR|nr:oxidoreductase domain containing [Trichoderma arundinaceum]